MLLSWPVAYEVILLSACGVAFLVTIQEEIITMHDGLNCLRVTSDFAGLWKDGSRSFGRSGAETYHIAYECSLLRGSHVHGKSKNYEEGF